MGNSLGSPAPRSHLEDRDTRLAVPNGDVVETVWTTLMSSKCAGTHTRHQPGAGACSEGYEYGASRPAAGGVRERMDIWGKDVT